MNNNSNFSFNNSDSIFQDKNKSIFQYKPLDNIFKNNLNFDMYSKKSTLKKSIINFKVDYDKIVNDMNNELYNNFTNYNKDLNNLIAKYNSQRIEILNKYSLKYNDNITKYDNIISNNIDKL